MQRMRRRKAARGAGGEAREGGSFSRSENEGTAQLHHAERAPACNACGAERRRAVQVARRGREAHFRGAKMREPRSFTTPSAHPHATHAAPKGGARCRWRGEGGRLIFAERK